MALELEPSPLDLGARIGQTEKRLDNLESSMSGLRASSEATRSELGALSAEIRRASVLPAAGLGNLLVGAATGSSVTAPAPVATSLIVAAVYLVLPRLVAYLRQPPSEP